MVVAQSVRRCQARQQHMFPAPQSPKGPQEGARNGLECTPATPWAGPARGGLSTLGVSLGGSPVRVGGSDPFEPRIQDWIRRTAIYPSLIVDYVGYRPTLSILEPLQPTEIVNMIIYTYTMTRIVEYP